MQFILNDSAKTLSFWSLLPCAMFQLLKAIKLSNQWTPSARVCSMGSTANGRTLGQKSGRGKGKKAILEFFALRRL